MRFYALVIWRSRGVVPRDAPADLPRQRRAAALLPRRGDLLATERKVEALWQAISLAQETGDWRPRKSSLCGWCAHQALCPAWGGTPPPLPTPETDATPEADAAPGA